MGMCSVIRTGVYAVGDIASGTGLGQNWCWIHFLKPSGKHEEIQNRIRCCYYWRQGSSTIGSPRHPKIWARTQVLPNLCTLFFLFDHLFSQLHMRGFNCLIFYSLPVQIFCECSYIAQNGTKTLPKKKEWSSSAPSSHSLWTLYGNVIFHPATCYLEQRGRTTSSTISQDGPTGH